MAAVKTKKVAPKAATKKAAGGPRPATLTAAKEVVRLRDRAKMPWSEIADEVGVSPSQLRRLYTLGGGKADGARYGEAPVAPKAPVKKAPTKAKARSRGTAKPKAAPKARRASRKAA